MNKSIEEIFSQGVVNLLKESVSNCSQLFPFGTSHNKDGEGSKEPIELSVDNAIVFAKKAQQYFPEIVSTRISEIINENTGIVTIVQTMIDSENKTVYTDDSHEDCVGRQLPKDSRISEGIRILMGGDVTCVLPLPQYQLTYTDVLAYARSLKTKGHDITATMLSRVKNEQTGQEFIWQTMLDSNGETIYSDRNRKDFLGRHFPPNTQLCDKLTDLMEEDGKCTISISLR
ncbi:MAG: hypothetical protein Q4G68_07805 [Planctomycetia bacterium]|nr:hypothetical protein [Planctomycetia bacterium]